MTAVGVDGKVCARFLRAGDDSSEIGAKRWNRWRGVSRDKILDKPVAVQTVTDDQEGTCRLYKVLVYEPEFWIRLNGLTQADCKLSAVTNADHPKAGSVCLHFLQFSEAGGGVGQTGVCQAEAI